MITPPPHTQTHTRFPVFQVIGHFENPGAREDELYFYVGNKV